MFPKMFHIRFNIFIFCMIQFFSLIIITESTNSKRQAVHPDAFSTSMDIMLRQGYSIEWHTVTTTDGYLLEIHRLIGKRYSDVYNNRINVKFPVLLIHGILCSSAEFTNNRYDQSLAYRLAQTGYDVWMINLRGNAYSRRHTQYNPTQSQFWDWSWQQMADYDLPNVIDFVLKTTNRRQIYLVGYSMGTTIPFATLSTRPEYNAKVRALFALSPIAYLSNARGLINILALLEGVFRGLATFGLGELLPQSGLMQAVANTICNGPQAIICETAISIVLGDQPGCLNKTRLPVYLSHFPAGTSMVTLLHYFQIMKTGVFEKFDLGLAGNLEYYGTERPPVYSLSKIGTYVNLYYIDGDYLSSGDEARRIQSELTGSPRTQLIRLQQPLCGHIWLAWGTQMYGYNDIIQRMEDDWYRNIYPPRFSGRDV